MRSIVGCWFHRVQAVAKQKPLTGLFLAIAYTG
jgi:hypothetical protein